MGLVSNTNCSSSRSRYVTKRTVTVVTTGGTIASRLDPSGGALEAFGIGNANHEVLAEVERAVGSGVPVVIVSRCLEGTVEPVYGNSGGHDLKEVGAIFGGSLSGQKAGVLLMDALAAAQERGEPLEDLSKPHLVI